MKRFVLALLALLFTTASHADPFEVNNPLTLDLKSVLKLVKANLNGWNKLSLEGERMLWTPASFYAEKISDPKAWISQIRQLGFCQPDKVWKNFPVLATSNEFLSEGIEQVALNPNLNYVTQMTYSETVMVGGKARNVSYDFRQDGPAVNVTCSAANELGDVQSIQQNFNINNPKKFEVQQKKNGKLLEI